MWSIKAESSGMETVSLAKAVLSLSSSSPSSSLQSSGKISGAKSENSYKCKK